MSQHTTRRKIKPAAKFLLAIAALVSLFILAAIIFGLWSYANPVQMLRIAFTPDHAFAESEADPQLDYNKDTSWAALPDKYSFASARPEGVLDIAQHPAVDIFFIHPTTYLKRTFWNAPSDASEANERLANRVLKHQASAFNLAGRIFVPRYRQATFGAFFDIRDNGKKAISLAFIDVLAAFDNFIQNRSNGRPFILAGHSQGSLHLLTLLQKRISGTALQARMVAAYVIGWPVSIEADLGALPGISACQTANDTGCVISYQTFGQGGDPAFTLSYMNSSTGLGGMPRKGTQMLCTNPQSWKIGGSGTRTEHLGAIVPQAPNAKLGKPIAAFTDTQCGPDGILYIQGQPGADWQPLKMFGENYHAYDYHMFYMNIRENAATRARAWLSHSKTNVSQDSQP